MNRIKCLSLFCLLAAVSGKVWGYSCSTTNSGSINLPLPTSVGVSRDLPNGSALTSWTRVETNTTLYKCTSKSGGQEWVGTKINKQGAWASSGTTYDGYTVWQTDVAGVGIAIRTYIYWSGASCNRGWMGPSNLPTGGGGYGDGGNDMACRGGASVTYTMGNASDAILVKTGTISGGTISKTHLYSQFIYGDGDEWYGKGGYDRKYYVPEIKVSTRSCSTPDVSVPLGNHSPSEFVSVGSQSTPVKFDLKINSCPAGMTTVKYGFNFSGKDYKPSEGLFGLTSNSTAKGIKVKLMNAAGTAVVKLDEWITLSDYKSATGGTYTVSLSAAYLRTGDITPGTANAELIIAMNYN